jgi:hypothetical protein
MRIVATTALLALALTACGGGGDAGEDERARTVTAPSSAAAGPEGDGDGDKTLTEAQLQAALLTVPELPTGYKAAAEEQDDDDNETTGTNDECSAKFEQLGEAEGQESASAEASFEGGFGVLLEQGLESYEDEDTVQQRFDDVVEVLSQCQAFTSTDDDGVTTEFTIGALSFPKLGDDTVALAVTGRTPDFNLSLNFVVVRLGRNVMSIAQGGLTTDAASLEQAARRGLEKLAAASG